MSAEPYLGQIILVAFTFPPVGWAFCNGQLLQIAEYDALFHLIGTTYGGDGETTFAVPDLRGRIPIGPGQGPATQNYFLGEAGGVETIIPTMAQLGAHTHAIDTSTFAGAAACKNGPGNERTPVGNVHASEAAGATMPYSSAAPDGSMNVDPLAVSGSITVAPAGGTEAHDNMQPFLTMNFCIALFGVFPSAT
jgi:microcystin-dependent protein